MTPKEPLYLANITRLKEVSQELDHLLECCNLCPRNCGVNRKAGELGFCRAPAKLMVSSVGPHFGEEPPLVGWGGSGTIFLTHCNLRCVFCQNFEISHMGRGDPVDTERMAGFMLWLQDRGCHNINFVTPTHYLPQILQALHKAALGGLRIPVVYNSGGYESLEIIRKMKGLIDIYMPDIKFFDSRACSSYLQAPDYGEVVRGVVKEMHGQVGDLEIQDGLATRGVLVRHLVMPGWVEDAKEIMGFIAREISVNTYVNIMFQYRPLYRAHEFPEIARRPSLEEYREVCRYARALGLQRGFHA